MEPRVLAEGDMSYHAVIGEYLLESMLRHEHLVMERTERARRHHMLQYEMTARVLTLRLAMAELGLPNPARVLEVGHAGSLVTSHAFPDATVVCLDGDMKVLSNEINCVPDGFWEQRGKRYKVRWYDDLRVSDLRLVEEVVPNYRRVVGYIESTPIADASVDLAIAIGEPFFSDHGEIVARTVRPGGHLLTIIDGWPMHPRRPSFYETGVYSFPLERPYLRTWNGPGLEKLEIPLSLRQLEKLCEWEEDGRVRTTGYVFEAFRKP